MPSSDGRRSPESVTESERYAALVVADFDGDGVSDVATFHEQQGVGARIFRGSSVGFNAPWVSYPTSLSSVSPEPTSAKIADFTGDGRNDVLVIARDGVTLRIGSEHDAFAQAIETPIDQRFAVTRTADFTGDGILDLCLEGAPGTSRDLVSVMPGTGNGAFGAPIAPRHDHPGAAPPVP